MMGSATDMSRQQTSVKLHRLRTTVVAYSAVVATRAGPCIHTYICDSELVACAKLLPGRLLVPILFRLRLPAHFQCLEFFFIDLPGWVFVAHCDGTDLAFIGLEGWAERRGGGAGEAGVMTPIVYGDICCFVRLIGSLV